jgi:hypothetical protein
LKLGGSNSFGKRKKTPIEMRVCNMIEELIIFLWGIVNHMLVLTFL